MPVCLTYLAAASINLSCILEQKSTSWGVWLVFLVISFAITPSQLHGASSNTLSNFFSNLPASKPSIVKMQVLYTPQRAMLNDIDLALLLLGSSAIMAPLFFIFCAMNVVLPPGAAATSNTV